MFDDSGFFIGPDESRRLNFYASIMSILTSIFHP